MHASHLLRIRRYLLSFLLWSAVAAQTASAAFNVLSYWHIGENDPGAAAGAPCTNLIDSVGGRTLTNTPHGAAYPMYTNNPDAAATSATGSRLAVQMDGGQSSAGNVISGLTDNFGVELWVRPLSSSGVQALVYNGNTSASGWGIYRNGNSCEALFGGVAIFAVTPLSTNIWTHLALVRAGGTTTFYTNGVALGSTATAPAAPAGSLLLGANNARIENFLGALDEVRIFSFGAGEFNVTNLLYRQATSFTLSSNSFSFSATGGTNSLTLTVVPTNVSWSASANVSWLHLTNTAGAGSATLVFTYDDNPWVARSGTLTVAGQTVTVTQGPPAYSLSGNYSYYWTGEVFEEPATGATDYIGLTVTPNAGTWSVTSYADWIHPSPASGAGSTNLPFIIDPNTNSSGAARYGMLYLNNAAGSMLRWVVFQQAPASGTGQATYRFTGKLQAYLPQYIPSDASTNLKSVQAGDVFYMTMTIVPGASSIYYGTYACSVNAFTFSVPSRGLVYSRSFADLEVLADNNNPHTLRADANGVDSTVNMIFWARDFTHTALASGSVPFPLNLSGFHADGFAQIILYNGVGGNPTLFYGDLVPLCDPRLAKQNQTNTLSWVTSDTFYAPAVEAASSLGANGGWTALTNQPALLGLTNLLALPATNSAQFYRLRLL
jgi:hypothetical protein